MTGGVLVDGLAEILRAKRKEKRLSQYQLADQTGIDRSTISQMENSIVQKPPAENLIKIANVLEMDVHELFIAAGYPVESNNRQELIAEAEKIEKDLHELIVRMKKM